MRGAHAGIDAPLLGTFKWLPCEAAICNTKNRRVGARCQYPSPYGLTTVAEQQGRDSGGYPKPSHMYQETFILAMVGRFLRFRVR